MLADYIAHYKGFFPNDFCDSVVEKYKDAGWSQHTWQTNGQNTVTYDTQELSVYLLDKPEDRDTTLVLWQNISNCIGNYQAERNVLACVANVSNVRLNKYSTGTLMREHVDHIYDLFDGTKKGIPVLSIVVNLNDAYTGGEFRFFKDTEIKLKKGDVLIFPSNFMYPHAVNEVTSGTRYSAVAWAY